MRLLLIEDNPRMLSLLRQGFAEQGYAVDTAECGRDGEAMAAGEPYDAVVLDLMLPDVDGVCLCRNLRRRGVRTPVLMLTALSATEQKVSGLDAGADDYLTKPFEFAELTARVRALLRRGENAESSVLRFEDVEMNLLRRQVTRGGEKIKLTAKEFQLLEYFMRNPDRLLTRTELGEHVWDMNFNPASNVIDVYVHVLRRKLEAGRARPLIHTRIRAGYVLSAEPPE